MLTTYLLALSIAEFAERLRRGELFKNHDSLNSRLWVPLRFISEDGGIQQRAREAILLQSKDIQTLFPDAAARNAARNQWSQWISFCAQMSKSEHRYGEGADALARYADLLPSTLTG